MGMQRQIDYYFSLPSPWAYNGHSAFRKAISDYNCRVNCKPVPLIDLFSETGGLPVTKRHPARQRYRLMELRRWRDKRGLSFHIKPAHWPYKTTLPDQLVIAISAAGHDPDSFLQRAFAGVWEQQLDLGNHDTLIQLADAAGLPGARLIERARSNEIAAAYQKNREDAIAADVLGSPGYVLDGEVFWGQDRIDLLADALKLKRKPYCADI
jgi:2-hydroxychromene-2-carboxylate isomerase